jgi:integrase
MSGRAAADVDPEDPVGYFLEDLTYHGKTDRTRRAYERVLREFEAFLGDPDRGPGGESVRPDEATYRHCMGYVHHLRGDVGPSSVATYAAYLHRFYAYMTQVGAFDSNPMSLVTEELDERVQTDPERREISLSEMRSFVIGVPHPLHQAVLVTLLKTGIRVGELCNLDLRDLRLVDSVAGSAYDLTGRGQLSGRGDSLYVSAAPARGETVNGEERTASNKRQRDTVIPVDAELRTVLERWLAARPDSTSPAEPLFTSTADNWGQRLTPKSVRAFVADHAADAGWYRSGDDAAENVTPHYFRHFFTTHLRDRTGDRGVVKYLRGDVADDIIDTYTHNWGDRVRQSYEEHIYRLFETPAPTTTTPVGAE